MRIKLFKYIGYGAGPWGNQGLCCANQDGSYNLASDSYVSYKKVKWLPLYFFERYWSGCGLCNEQSKTVRFLGFKNPTPDDQFDVDKYHLAYDLPCYCGKAIDNDGMCEACRETMFDQLVESYGELSDDERKIGIDINDLIKDTAEAVKE